MVNNDFLNQDGSRDMCRAINKETTEDGLLSAGGSLPEEIGNGGAANIRRKNIAPNINILNEKISHDMAVSKFAGLEIEDTKKCKTTVAEVQNRLHIKNGEEVKLAMWMKALREIDKGEASIKEGSIAHDIRQSIEGIAGDGAECKVYGTFLYKEIGFPGGIDIVVDIKFDQREFTTPIFRSIRILSSESGVDSFIDYSQESRRGINYAINSLDKDSSDYVGIINKIAKTIVNDARVKHQEINRERYTGYEGEKRPAPITYFS